MMGQGIFEIETVIRRANGTIRERTVEHLELKRDEEERGN